MQALPLKASGSKKKLLALLGRTGLTGSFFVLMDVVNGTTKKWGIGTTLAGDFLALGRSEESTMDTSKQECLESSPRFVAGSPGL